MRDSLTQNLIYAENANQAIKKGVSNLFVTTASPYAESAGVAEKTYETECAETVSYEEENRNGSRRVNASIILIHSIVAEISVEV